MGSRKVSTRKKPVAATLTLHLGEQPRHQLDRLRQLLYECGDYPTIPSLGVTVRLAVRSLLIQMLGSRANFQDPADPYLQEYLTLAEEDIRQRFKADDQEQDHSEEVANGAN